MSSGWANGCKYEQKGLEIEHDSTS
jgi:hypothetical protein